MVVGSVALNDTKLCKGEYCTPTSLKLVEVLLLEANSPLLFVVVLVVASDENPSALFPLGVRLDEACDMVGMNKLTRAAAHESSCFLISS